MDRGLGGFQRQRVHDFQRARQKPAGDDGRNGITGLFERAVAGQDGVKTFGPRQKLEGDFDGDAEEAFVAGEEATPVRSGVFAAGAAPLDDFARSQHGPDAEDVVGGHAVLEAMGPAGVEGDVAADGADGLAGRIGRVVQTVRSRGERDLGVEDARLDHRHAQFGIEAQDAVEAVERDHHAVGDGERSARQAGAAPARDERQALRMATPDQGDDFVRCFREGHGERAGAESGQAVAFVSSELLGASQETLGREQRGEAVESGLRHERSLAQNLSVRSNN